MTSQAAIEGPDSHEVDPRQYAKAFLNILSDFDEDRLLLRNAQRAALNILEDVAANENWLHSSHRAVLNLLEDSEFDKHRLGATQRALLNVLDDTELEKSRLHATQRALLNILEDVDTERQERARAEAVVRLLNAELEQRVASRTSELVSTNQELETFAYSVSHDLRTPLRAIDGFSKKLAERYSGQLDSEGQRLISVVRDGARKMAQLINDILAFSRIGRVDLNTRIVSMEQLVQDVLRELEPIIGQRDVQFSIGTLPPGKGDTVMLRRVWMNLLENAVKYTSTRDRAIIRVGSECKHGETIYFVSDNGVGFDMQYLDKLFGVFQRLHGPDEFSGTGIGLAIIKRIITRHGGRVWAEGIPDEGATFRFALRDGEK